MLPLLRRALGGPLALAREVFGHLPAETQRHARAAADEGIAAARSLADGATDAAERAIDRVSGLITRA